MTCTANPPLAAATAIGLSIAGETGGLDRTVRIVKASAIRAIRPSVQSHSEGRWHGWTANSDRSSWIRRTISCCPRGGRWRCAGEPFAGLRYLAERDGQLPRKEELLSAICPETHAAEIS